MEIDIKNLLHDYIDGNKLTFLVDNNVLWNTLLDKISLVSLQYKISMIKYQGAYFKEKTDYYQDISLIIKRGGMSVGLWPLCLYMKDEKYHIGSLGQEIIPPIFIDGWGTIETKRAIYDECLSILRCICCAVKIETVDFYDITMEDGISLWNHKLMESHAHYKEMRNVLFYDLGLPVEDANKLLRRTNKYSIRKGYDLFETEIVTKDDYDLSDKFEKFRQYHIKISGRETRSKRTWDEQEDSIRTSNDFLVLLYDKEEHIMRGGALFAVTNSIGLYAVAAYDRELFDKPVGHVVQDVAINHMRQLHLRWYEIGERYYRYNTEDDKLINIGHYKEGFATHSYYKAIMELKI